MSEPNDTVEFRGASPRMAGLDFYFGDVGRRPMIGPEREKELGYRAQAGDEDAIMELARANLRFAVQVAKKYQNRGLILDDLIQEANLGLVKAARKFDPDRGVKFISYAVWWIRQSILAALADHSRPVRVPLNRNADLSKIAAARSRLQQELGREPTPKEIAEAADLRTDEVEDLLPLNEGVVRLDAPIGNNEGDQELVERFENEATGEPAEEVERKILAEEVERALGTLRERDATVLRMYFGLGDTEPMTLKQIGQVFGVTRERIRQLRNRALDQLKEGEWSRALRSFAA